ncbi:addiction module protein [Chryseobacterium nematophagum]|nr:addiction module protein [Chryseobacterium nematophagum]
MLDERLEEHRNNPTSGKSWKEVIQDLKNKYGI